MDEANGLYDCIYVSPEGFWLLAGLAGMDEVKGLFPEQVQLPSDEALYQLLFALGRDGLLEPDEEDGEPFLRPSPLVRELFQTIRDAEETRILRNPDTEEDPGSGQMACVYIGKERSVVTQILPRDARSMRLFGLRREQLDEWLQDQETQGIRERTLISTQKTSQER